MYIQKGLYKRAGTFIRKGLYIGRGLIAKIDAGFSDYYQWLFPRKSTDIQEGTYPVHNYGTGLTDADVKSFNQTIVLNGTTGNILIKDSENLGHLINGFGTTDIFTFNNITLTSQVIRSKRKSTESGAWQIRQNSSGLLEFYYVHDGGIKLIYTGVQVSSEVIYEFITYIENNTIYITINNYVTGDALAVVSEELLTRSSDTQFLMMLAARRSDLSFEFADITYLFSSFKNAQGDQIEFNFKETNGLDVFNRIKNNYHALLRGQTRIVGYSEYSINSLYKNGGELYYSNENPNNKIRVEKMVVEFLSPDIDGYYLAEQHAPNAGVWDTQSTYQNQDNEGLNALFDKYAELGFLKHDNLWDFIGLKSINQPAYSIKFGLFSDGHQQQATDPNNGGNQYSAAKLANAAIAWESNNVDMAISLGDMIDSSVSSADDLLNLDEMETSFENFTGDKRVIIGNHDSEELGFQGFIDNSTYTPNGYWSEDKNGFHLIFLSADAGNYFTMSETQLDWLENDLANSSLPKIVFIHYKIYEDYPGTPPEYTYEPYSTYAYNSEEIRSTLEADGNVLIVFSGHAHTNYNAKANGIQYLGFASMFSSDQNSNAYSIVEVNSVGSVNVVGYDRHETYEVIVSNQNTGIPVEDYRQTVSEDGKTVYDVALQPYESEPLKDVNGEILYDANGEKMYPLKY